MRAIMYRFILFVMILALVPGCEKQPNAPASYRPIRLHFNYVDEPSQPSLFDPSISDAARMGKINRLVDDQVLLLHCDDESLYVAKDATAYGNDFTLYSVTKDTSATPALKSAFGFNGDNSYGLSEYYGSGQSELNGTHGLEISFYMFLTSPETYYEQRMIDRHDALGGYTIGTNYGHLYFRAKQNGVIFEATGTTTLVPRTWYQVTARFDRTNLVLLLDGKSEATTTLSGPITPSSRATIIGAGWNGDIIGYGFNGRLDEISVRSTVEYIDFDLIQLAVIDLSGFTGQNDFHNSEQWRAYWADLEKILADTIAVPTWNNYVDLWSKHFDVASEQNLTVNGAFAQGTIRGIEGMNLLTVAGVQKGAITYVGEGFVMVFGGEVTDAYIELWPWERGEY